MSIWSEIEQINQKSDNKGAILTICKGGYPHFNQMMITSSASLQRFVFTVSKTSKIAQSLLDNDRGTMLIGDLCSQDHASLSGQLQVLENTPANARVFEESFTPEVQQYLQDAGRIVVVMQVQHVQTCRGGKTTETTI
ncbi:hypothetical protein SS50377_21944 [Spironucleus salmonicida]|uniref:Pyridoxamine 5'-phosphate oxidase putative domain-containing protein n=1 Tax=Spironucleus salmonicida TaxID=348837 RepID=V6LQX1_9EUKA|nr:hypothetical protein SS50377_21944 [Spironucleus salmonicida]|eukprot:EST46985.1 Hypothetical protein SS50377_12937 [Spironucleus salmonicida]